MAEYYSAELSQKVRRGMRESRLKGNFTGGRVPYGYRAVDKKIVIEEDEAEIVRRIFREYAGGKFVKNIVADLTREGIYFKGKPFLSGSVYNMLQNEKYAGIFRYKEEVFTNIYPRIVPEEVYRIVRGLAAENKNGTHLPEVCYLLKDKLVCGYCGRPIASESGTARNGETIRYYKCSGRKKLQDCNKATIGKEVLESLVVDTTLQVLNDPDTVELLAERLMDTHKKRRSNRRQPSCRGKAGAAKVDRQRAVCHRQGHLYSFDQETSRRPREPYGSFGSEVVRGERQKQDADAKGGYQTVHLQSDQKGAETDDKVARPPHCLIRRQDRDLLQLHGYEKA